MPENYINIPAEGGSIALSPEVLTAISAGALAEVEGAVGFESSVSSEIYELLGKKTAAKVTCTAEDEKIIVDVTMMVRYGFSVAKVAGAAQNAVITALESMTGITPVVNVTVSGIAFDK